MLAKKLGSWMVDPLGMRWAYSKAGVKGSWTAAQWDAQLVAHSAESWGAELDEHLAGMTDQRMVR